MRNCFVRNPNVEDSQANHGPIFSQNLKLMLLILEDYTLRQPVIFVEKSDYFECNSFES
jgi:hypothetical protein